MDSIAFTLIIALSMAFCAYRLGFFTFSSKRDFSSLNFRDCAEAFFLFALLQFCIIPIVLFFGFISGHVGWKSEDTGWLNLAAIAFMATILGSFFYCKKEKLQSLFRSLAPFHDIQIGILSWFVAFPFAICISQVMVFILSDYLGYTLQDQTAVIQMKENLDYPLLYIASTAAVVLIVPILEEILFRGFLQTALKEIFNPIQAIVICAFMFSLFHFSFSQGINNLNILASLFVLALFLGFLRERQGNLLPSIALHATFNGMSVLMILLQSS